MPRVLPSFREELKKLSNPRILEIGSRVVTDSTLKTMIELQEFDYVGLDIHEGENVDVVGDAHSLGSLFPPDSFDAVMTKSVFEHIGMPWKVAIEMNKVLKPNGLFYVHTHSCFPLHERPWDFWRYSKDTWNILFNSVTGFEITLTEEEFMCTIVPDIKRDASYSRDYTLADHVAFLHTNVLGRKTHNYDSEKLRWDLDVLAVTNNIYPTGK